jgi:ADP-ribosylglycohydrolase
VFIATIAEDFESGVRMALMSSGNRHAVAEVAGELLGARFGYAVIPRKWRARLELGPVIAKMANDLHRHFGDPEREVDPGDDWNRYPGW